MGEPEVGAVVAGAGIAGLAAALELQRAGGEVLVVDASDRPGGVMRTEHVSGYVIERGPNTTQIKAPMLEFLRAQRAEGQLLAASPASRLRFIYAGGELVRVPSSPLSLLQTPLLTGRGKLRLLCEPLIRRGDATAESVEEFIGRRLGREAVSGLIGPFLTGVYAGDERELGAEAVFPAWVELERSSRSLALGLARGVVRRGSGRGLRGSYSAAEGFGPFARALSEGLVEPPALESRLTGIRRDGPGWLIFVSGPGGERRLRSPRVVLAVPAREAAEILRGVSSELAEALEAIDYAPIVSVSLGVDPQEVRRPVEGFGFLVPRDEGASLLGCLFMSQLFPNRAPAGRELFQCLLGGVRWREVVDLPDDVLLERLHSDLDRILGLNGEPKTLAVTRWPRAIPQPRPDHVARIQQLRSTLARFPGLSIAGSYCGGISISDSLESGLCAAREPS